MPGTAIEFRHVAFSRAGKPVLDHFTLEVVQGEVLALVGRSGAGKTTLLKLVNRLLLPDAGAVLVEGRDTLSTIAEATLWLREGHARLRESIAVLSDAELLRPRMTSWDELKETRWIITMIIQHDLYHAGEINHLRALHQQNDL